MASGLEEMKDIVRPARDRIGTHRATKESTSLRLSWTTSLRLIPCKGRHDLRTMFRLTQCIVSYVYF
jgi:hypothetical protein